MDIFTVLEQLQRKGRLSYRILQLQFQLDDEQLEVLKEEPINIQWRSYRLLGRSAV